MFTSTRGKVKVSSYDALVNGLSKDGGLFVLDQFPKVKLEAIKDMDYVHLCGHILGLLFSDIHEEELLNIAKEVYPQSFDCENVLVLKHFDNHSIMELDHGPTYAFKDIALTYFPKLLSLAKNKIGLTKDITVLNATSGDTGGATLSGFKDIDNINTLVLYPYKGTSQIQEQQMLSFQSKNAKVLAIESNFDECQRLVKEIFRKNPTHATLSSSNSINVGRLFPQVVYYFYTYFQLLKDGKIKNNERINFVVPTGNFGDILAGYIALNMGCPINKLICASNQNNVLYDFFKTGRYDIRRDFYKTNSPSMDILISSNLERLLYYVLDNDYKEVKILMDSLSTHGYYNLPKEAFDKLKMFGFGYANEDDTIKTIKDVYNDKHYLLDPHGAVAYKVYKDLSVKDKHYSVILETASPYKFTQGIKKALNLQSIDEISLMQGIKNVTGIPIPLALEKLAHQQLKPTVVSKEEAYEYILNMIGGQKHD